MSSLEENNNQLRDLVSRTLKSKGVLSKVQAQIRASVFLALEENNDPKDNSPFLNNKLKDFITSSDGILALSLVKEMLQFFNLEYTLAVFEPEISCGLDVKCQTRDEMIEKLNVKSDDPNQPVLSLLLKCLSEGSPSESTSNKNSASLSVQSNEKPSARRNLDLLSFDLLSSSPREVPPGNGLNLSKPLGNLASSSQNSISDGKTPPKSDKFSTADRSQDAVDHKSKSDDQNTESEIEEDISEISLSGDGSVSSVDISLSKVGKGPTTFGSL